ncbi:hypothetical protein EMPS_05027 [Entomortierella parvispora]|uniref:C2H2-type domain-containing protein n=1 Tax=Entomortierella parvispora TaxID=205924 RepID=A0A9P3LW47_9FUNG|nr:hypothetical protein EMPS_05027 [Entomortierella parvispora]
MSLDQCIAALAKVERGAIRDIFGPIPTRPEPYSLNLTQEYSRFSVQPDSGPDSGPVTGAGSRSLPSGPRTPPPSSVQQQSSGSNGDGRFSCGPCKKSFGSEATFHSHQMSAKHIAAVKDVDKKNKGKGASKSNSTNNNARGKQRVEEEEQDHPEVSEALLSLRKVEKIVKENPNMAASVLWKIAKVLWSHRQSQETARVLSLLINVLSDLQSAAASNTAPAQPGSLTPTQISMTLYLSRLSLARLVIYHSPSLAAQCYMDAIQGRWQIPPEEIQYICEMVNTSSQAQTLAHTKTFLSTHSKTEKLMQPPPPPATGPEVAKKAADPNLKLLTVLLECSSMIIQTGAIVQDGKSNNKRDGSEDRALGETSLGLLSMALALAEASEDIPGTIDLLRTMAAIFKSPTFRMPSSASSCLIKAAELCFNPLSSSKAADADLAVKHPHTAWDLLQALLFATEAGDFVRMRHSIRLLRRISGPGCFQDVDAIVQVAQAVLAQDNDFLHCDSAFALEHLLLLVKETGDTLAEESSLLMCRYSSPLASVNMLEKLQQLIK